MNEEQIKAMMQEFSTQRAMLGDRAVSLTGQLAIVMAENDQLKKQVEALTAQLQKPAPPQ